MEDLCISKKLNAFQIQQCLQNAMPQLTAFAWAIQLGEEEPTGFDSNNSNHIFFELAESGIAQFPVQLSVYRTPNENCESRALWLGRRISAQFSVDVLVPFMHPENSYNPYYSIVFQDGNSYLADDSGIGFDEFDAKPIRLLSTYALPEVIFDSTGNLSTPA